MSGGAERDWPAAGSAEARVPGSALLIAAWLLYMISVPIQQWVWGAGATVRGAALGVVFQALVVVVLFARAAGTARAARILALAFALAWAVEAVGVATGFPFGAYRYTDRLQPQALGVPLLIPLAWLMMLPPSWAVAARLAGGRRVPFVVLSALAFTAWDLFLDPQMVAWGLWEWQSPGGYFGIPWVNFAGWAGAAAAVTALVDPPGRPSGPLLAVYAFTWALETVALGFFWRLPGPAAAGCAAMGLWAALAWRARPGGAR